MLRKIKIFAYLFVPIIFLHASCLAAEQDRIAQIFQEEADSIVLVGAAIGKKTSIGTGFIISKDGLIATNYHVISKSKRLSVRFNNGRTYGNVKLLEFDPVKDLAIIKVNASGLNPVKLGNSDSLQIGQRIVTIGNPLGLEHTVSDGLISSIRDVKEGHKVLQISVPLSNGSSGGPIFNLNGEVVGVAVGAYAGGQNLNFAVPINYLKPLLKKVGYYKFEIKKVIRKKPLKDEYTLYVIQPKDTLYSISKKFGISVNEIREVNGLSGNNIYRGQKIKVPKI